MENDTVTSKLIQLNNRIRFTKISQDLQSKKKSLISPSDDVVTVCKTAEKVIRSTPNLFSMKYVLERLVIHAKMLLSGLNLFSKMDLLPEKATDSNHKLDLINLILKNILISRGKTFTTCD